MSMDHACNGYCRRSPRVQGGWEHCQTILKREDIPQEVVKEQMEQVFGMRVVHMALAHEMSVEEFFSSLHHHVESYHPRTGLVESDKGAALQLMRASAYQVWRVHFVMTPALDGEEHE